jgi:hypothetical protein
MDLVAQLHVINQQEKSLQEACPETFGNDTAKLVLKFL